LKFNQNIANKDEVDATNKFKEGIKKLYDEQSSDENKQKILKQVFKFAGDHKDKIQNILIEILTIDKAEAAEKAAVEKAASASASATKAVNSFDLQIESVISKIISIIDNLDNNDSSFESKMFSLVNLEQVKEEITEEINKADTSYKNVKKEKASCMGNISFMRRDIEEYVDYRFDKKKLIDTMILASIYLVIIMLMFMLIKWYITQKDIAEKSLNINVLDKLNSINETNTFADMKEICLTCFNNKEFTDSFLNNEKPLTLEKFNTILQHIYENYDKIYDHLEKIDIMFMITEFSKSATVIDTFMSKSNDAEEGLKQLKNDEKLKIVRNEIFPLFKLKVFKVEGLRYTGSSVTNEKSNFVYKTVLKTNVNSSKLLSEFSSCSEQLVEKINNINNDLNKQFIFASLIYNSSSNDISCYILYIGKFDKFDNKDFDDKRTFNCLKVDDNNTNPYVWFSEETIKSGKLVVNKDECSEDKNITVDDIVIEEGILPESKCKYYLNLFSFSIDSFTFGTTSLLDYVVNDQPYFQVNSYSYFKVYIINDVLSILQRDKFVLNLQEYRDDLMNDLDTINKSPLLFLDLRDCFIDIIKDIEIKVSEINGKKSITDEYISFERFKKKISTMTCYDMSRDFAFNLLLMKSYGYELKKHYEDHDPYFENEAMSSQLFLIFIVFFIIIIW